MATYIALAIPIGFGLSSLLFFGCAFLLGFSSIHLISHTVGLCVISYILLMRRHLKKQKLKYKPDRSTIIFIVISLLVSYFATRKMYIPAPYSLNTSFVGDIPEEIALINSFYHGVNSGFVNIFKIRHPTCYKCTARSKWITAFHSAMIRLGKSSLRIALTFPSYCMIYSICFLIMKLAQQYMKGYFLPIVVLLVFLNAGSFGFVSLFDTKHKQNKDLDFVFNWGSLQTQWSHPLLQYIYAHRPSQLSICLCLSVFLLLATGASSKREMAYLGIVVGLLPGVQHQVWWCTLIYLICYTILTQFIYKSKDKKPAYITFLVIYFAVAAIQLLQYLPRSNRAPLIEKEKFSNSVMHKGIYFPDISLWIQALGFFPIFTLILCWFVIDKKLRTIYIPSCIIFLIGNYYRFQGYDRHNIFLFYPLWMTIASIVFVNTLYKFSKLPKGEEAQGVVIGFSIILVFCQVASSLLGFYRLSSRHVLIWNEGMEAAAEWIANNTPKKAVFISTDRDFDIVVNLAGKVSYFQSERNAWLYGFLHHGQTREITDLLKESDSTTIAPKIKYVVNHKGICTERHLVNWGRGEWSKVFENSEIIIYQRHL